MARREAGFYATKTEIYYVSRTGRAWVVQSEDDLGTEDPAEVPLGAMPADARSIDHMMTPDEAIEHCRRIEVVFGVSLIED